MEKLFHANVTAFASTDEALRALFQRFFYLRDVRIVRKNGKPYLENAPQPLYFSVSHTDDELFIAVSDKNVGVDAEKACRRVEYKPILKRFSPSERREIANADDFLRHWTIKESAVKWLGSTLAHDLRKLQYASGKLLYESEPFPVLLSVLRQDDVWLAVCCENDFSQAERIEIV